MNNNSYSLLKVCEDVVQNINELLPIQQTVHDNNQAKDLCDQVLASFEKIDQLQDGLLNMVNYLQYDQPEEQKMIDLENQINTHQFDINNNGGKLFQIQNQFINSPWLNMEHVNLLMGRGGQVKMEYLDKENILLDFKTKQQEKKQLLRKKLLTMKTPPKTEKIKLIDERCVVKTEIYQINYDLTYDKETNWFYWKIPKTKDIQISDNGLSYLQNFLKDDKSKKEIQNMLDDLSKQMQKSRMKLNQLMQERNARLAKLNQKKEEKEQEIKEEEIENNKDMMQSQSSVKGNNNNPPSSNIKIESMDLEYEETSIKEEFDFQILKYKEELKDQYVFCFVDQKIKTIFSDQVLEILQKYKNKEFMQKKFGPEVIFLQKNSETKDSLKFSFVLIKYQPQTAMLQSVLKQESLLKYKGENKIQQTSIYIEHISFDNSTYHQFILSQEKINFYKFLRSKTQAEQNDIIEKIQHFQPNYLDKSKKILNKIIIQEAIKNNLLPKQVFSLTPFDTIYIKTNITLSQIDSTLLTPFLNLEEENQHSVDSLFIINKPSDQSVANISNSDNGSYLQVVIGDKIDVEIILQQYRIIMLQQFFISNQKLSQQEDNSINSMRLQRAEEIKTNNITLLIRQKREIEKEDLNIIKNNKVANWNLSQAVIKLSSHPKIKNIIYQVLICIKVTCSGLIESQDEPEIYYIIIPYLTDKQHYLIYSSHNSQMIELDSQREQELDELIQDLQKKEVVIQDFVSTVFLSYAVQQNIFHSQFKTIKEESFDNYKQILLECRLKDELNSDKPIRITIKNNFDIKFQYYFGDLPEEKQMESIPRDCSFLQFYETFFGKLNLNIQHCLKHIYQRYYYLSDDRTKQIKDFLKTKISNDGWYSNHTLKIRPETIIQQVHSNNINHQIPGQQNHSSNNQHQLHQNGVQNGQLTQQQIQQMRYNQSVNPQSTSSNPQQPNSAQPVQQNANHHHHHAVNQAQPDHSNANNNQIDTQNSQILNSQLSQASGTQILNSQNTSSQQSTPYNSQLNSQQSQGTQIVNSQNSQVGSMTQLPNGQSTNQRYGNQNAGTYYPQQQGQAQSNGSQVYGPHNQVQAGVAGQEQNAHIPHNQQGINANPQQQQQGGSNTYAHLNGAINPNPAQSSNSQYQNYPSHQNQSRTTPTYPQQNQVPPTGQQQQQQPSSSHIQSQQYQSYPQHTNTQRPPYPQ